MSLYGEILKDFPAGYWILNETSGTAATDYSGYGNDATASVARAVMPISSGNKYSGRTSSGSYIRFPDVSVLKSGHESVDFTVEMLFRPSTLASTGSLFDAGNSNGLFYNNGWIEFTVSGGVTATCRYLIDTVATYHIAAVYTQGTIALFVNGESVDTQTVGDLVLASASSYYEVTSTSQFHVSNVAIYKTGLVASRIKAHADAAFTTNSVVDIAHENEPVAFTFDETASLVAMDYAVPGVYPWKSAVIDNLVVNEDNELTLRQIAAPSFNTGSGSFSGTALTLASGQSVDISTSGAVGAISGGITGNWYFSSTTHNSNANRYVLFSLLSSDARYKIEVYKEGIGAQVSVDYVYPDASGVSQTATVGVATPTYGGFRYIYLAYDTSEIRCYYVASGTSAAIQIADTAIPNFDGASTLYVGSSTDGTGYWNNAVKYVNLVDHKPDIADFTAYASTKIGNYTLPLGSDLNVSSYGSAIFTTDPTALDALDDLAISWQPILGATVSVSTDGTTYTQASYNGKFGGLVNGSTPATKIYIKAELQTDDSYNYVPVLRSLSTRYLYQSNLGAMTANDTMVINAAHTGGVEFGNVFDHSLYEGLMFSGDGAFHLDAMQNSSFLDFDGNTIPAGDARTFKTISFLFKTTSGHSTSTTYYYFSTYNGTTEFAFYHDGATNTYKFVGFDTCYVNGAAFTTNTAIDASGWTLVTLTKAGWAGLTPQPSTNPVFNFNKHYTTPNYYGQAMYRNVFLYPNILTATEAATEYDRLFGIDQISIVDTDTRSVTDDILYADVQYPRVLVAAWEITSGV